MIIANPIYDVVFKYLMEDLEIARGLISAIIGERVEEIQFEAQEHSIERASSEIHPHLLSLYRLDFIARIATEEGEQRKVLIELQKARLSSDVSRFREYLGQRYKDQDEVRDEAGEVVRTSLPIIAVFILGFDLEASFPACVKVDRRYLNLITGSPVPGKSEFLEQLSHDLYVIQARKLRHDVRSDLERVLSVFGQEHFVDELGHDIDYPEPEGGNMLLGQMLRRLSKIRQEPEVRKKMEFEDAIYGEFEAALKERTRDIKLKLREASRQAEEERKLKEEASKQAEEERKLKEEASRQAEEERKLKEETLARAVRALMAAGLSEEAARQQLEGD